MGGTDEPSNLLKVNTALHAFLHKMLWEEHGSEFDKVAWKCLSGQITNEEANIEATKITNTGRIPWNKGKKGVSGGRPKGMKHSEETKKKISEITKEKMKDVECGAPKGTEPWNKGKKIGSQSEESKKKKSETMKERWRHKKGGDFSPP